MTIHGDPDRIHIADSVMCDRHHLFFVAKNGDIYVEDDVVLGYEVRFLCGTHNYQLRGKGRHPSYEPERPSDIRVCRGAWIASFAILIGPCVINEDAVVGAGSVVTCDIPAGQLWAGNPAQFIKHIDFIS
jgi:acetyltransferase-like isoleucine patch superfamily enzyme